MHMSYATAKGSNPHQNRSMSPGHRSISPRLQRSTICTLVARNDHGCNLQMVYLKALLVGLCSEGVCRISKGAGADVPSAATAQKPEPRHRSLLKEPDSASKYLTLAPQLVPSSVAVVCRCPCHASMPEPSYLISSSGHNVVPACWRSSPMQFTVA